MAVRGEARDAGYAIDACPADGARAWDPEVWDDLLLGGDDGANEAEGDESAEEEEPQAEASGRGSGLERVVVLEGRPLGLEIWPASPAGRGGIVAKVEGPSADAGVHPGSSIVAIGSQMVDNMPTQQIREKLENEALPITMKVKPGLELPKGRKLKCRRGDPITVCTAHCRGSYRVVREAIAYLGWREITSDTREASVLWVEHNDSVQGVAPAQTVSRLTAFLHMCRKAPLARCLNQWLTVQPDGFDFLPPTWILPYDAAGLEAAMTQHKSTYIAKPSMGTQGRGIVLGRRWADFNDVVTKSKVAEAYGKAPNEYVVQRYIDSPLLLDGLKFDLRIYVVVTSIVPLRAYLFKEGIARFCTVPYAPPKDNNLQDACMHLTNFAVNKKSQAFQATEGLENHDEGSKRSASSVLAQIERTLGVTTEETWANIAELSANTLMALRPGLVEYYVVKGGPVKGGLHPMAPKGFQIIGLDILLDKDAKPHLLELNANPSLSVTQPVPVAGEGAGTAEPEGGDLEAEPSLPSPAAETPDSAAAASGPAYTSGGSADAAGSPEKGRAPETPAGSGMRAARAHSDHSTLQQPTRGNSKVAAKRPKTPDLEAFKRIQEKLQDLSSENLALVEAYIDSLAPAQPLAATARKARRDSTSTSPMRGRANSGAGHAGGGSVTERHAAGAAAAAAAAASSAAAPGRAGASSPAFGASAAEGAASHAGGRTKSLSAQSRHRLGLTKEKPPKTTKNVTSHLDLEIKRELIVQSLLLAKPARACKVARVRKQWAQLSYTGTGDHLVPLDDEGVVLPPDPEEFRQEVRPDAPDRCPAFEELDFGELAAPEVTEFAQAHLALYRCWLRSCGPNQDSLGQAQMMKLLEKRGCVGAGGLFPDKVAAQLWVTRLWRDIAEGEFGLDFRKFVHVAGRLGAMLGGGGGEEDADAENGAGIAGVVEFSRLVEGAGEPRHAAPAAE